MNANRLKLNLSRLSARESLEVIYDGGAEKFLGFMSNDKMPSSTSKNIRSVFAVTSTGSSLNAKGTLSSGNGDPYKIDSTARQAMKMVQNDVLQIGKDHKLSIGAEKGKGLESHPAVLSSKSAQQDLRSSFNVSSQKGENTVQVTVDVDLHVLQYRHVHTMVFSWLLNWNVVLTLWLTRHLVSQLVV